VLVKLACGVAFAGALALAAAAFVPADSLAVPRSAVACADIQPFIRGTPSRSLLSILGVLRRPATATDALPASLKRSIAVSFKFGGREVFANYIRRARVAGGVTYHVMPVLCTSCGFLKIHREAVAVWSDEGGGGAGTAATIEEGTAYGARGTFGHTTIQTLLPDGVAAVTLHYPAGKIGGFDGNHAPAFTSTANVVGNYLIVGVARGGNRVVAPMTTTWRATNGATIKTFNRL
jgi:hypothetical protein